MRERRLYWTVQLAGWGAYGISTYLAILPDLEPGQYLVVGLFKLVRTALGLGASHLLALAYDRLLPAGSVASAVGGGPGRGRLARLAVAGVGLSAALGVGWLLAYRTASAPLRPPAPPGVPWSAVPRASLDFAFVLLAWSALYVGARFRLEARRTAERARELELRMLRYQLNPHFLFNALSSIRAGLPAGAGTARDTVSELAEFLRYVLRRSPVGLTTLDEELAAVRSYLRVEEARYGRELRVEIDVEPAAREVRVPSLLLQPLVENAIKHGRAPGSGPPGVRIEARRVADELRVEVANRTDGEGRPDGPAAIDGSDPPAAGGEAGAAIDPEGPPGGLGIGLENVRDRLELAFPGRAELALARAGGWTRARLRIRGIDADGGPMGGWPAEEGR